MEYKNSNFSNSIDCQKDCIKYSIESVPEIFPQHVVNENNIDNRSVIEFNPLDLPNIITEQGKTLNKFCEQKKSAEEKAKKAKDKADEANNKKVGWLTGKKVAIEELQSATVSISEALESLTEAVNQSYINQEKIAKVNEYLLGLGLRNTTLNRMVIRELEMKLNNASPEELSELAKQELMSVLRQLKAQEDVQNRLEKQAEGLRFHDEKLEQHDERLEQLTNTLQTIIEKENNLKFAVDQIKVDFKKELKSEIRNLHSEVFSHISDQFVDVNETIREKENDLKSSINQLNTYLNNKLDSNINRFENLINENINKQKDTLESYKRENEILKNEANLLCQKFLKLQGQLKWYFVISVVATVIAVIGLII